MGGRGSSSGVGIGGGGGGGERIISTDDLLSRRERQQTEVDQVLGVLRDINTQYGYEVDGLDVATLGRGSKAMGYYEPGSNNIGINERFFDAQKIQQAYDKTVASGFHPSAGNKTGLEAVIAHETGHALTDVVAQKLGKDFDATAGQIVGEAFKAKTSAGAKKIAGNISGYARESDAECIAEAFADVYCNGRNASKESKQIVNALKKYL